jgi:hypothetical protein
MLPTSDADVAVCSASQHRACCSGGSASINGRMSWYGSAALAIIAACSRAALTDLLPQVTLLGLWLVPPVVSVHFRFWQFLGVWAVFTATTGYMLWLCTQRPIPRTTPRLVRPAPCSLPPVALAPPPRLRGDTGLVQAPVCSRPCSLLRTVPGCPAGVLLVPGALQSQRGGRLERLPAAHPGGLWGGAAAAPAGRASEPVLAHGLVRSARA